MILWKSAVIVLCLWASGNVATLLEESKIGSLKSNGMNYRLRNETYPIHYNLELTTRIDKEDFGFQGKVQIKIGVMKPTYVISLHAGTLNITQMQLLHSGKYSRLMRTSYSYNETTKILLILSQTKIEKGEIYLLTISYDGILSDDMRGFYRSWYLDDDDNKIYLATTQFEPTYARRAFPCYDEPKFKATFDISITHGKSYHALSNMAVKEEIDCDNETMTTVFETTVKMSSYLIAFVVSNFENISKGNQRVFTEPKLIKNADFALNSGIKLLDALETYLNVSYSINKMDQISIPQFDAGAMENWGLVTYRKEYLIYDSKQDTILRKYAVAKTIAHEYAHQWFGNLVSPDWWTYLWLNEGFATFFATEALQMCFPEMRIEEFDSIRLQGTFTKDSTNKTRSMSTYAEDHRSIKDLFDNIAYNKSSFVLRMTKNFLTEPVWKEGLNLYLNIRGFNSAKDTDLFDALQIAVDRSNVTLPKSVREILNTWTLNKGYPLISVKQIGEGLHFSQKRHTVDNTNDSDNALWWVPINIVTKSNPDFANAAADTWFNESEQLYTPSYKIKSDHWFLVNKRVMYYYRVNYESENWLKLADELSNGDYTKISNQNRAQLLADALLFAKDDQMDYGLAFNIVKYLKRETEYVPWGVVDGPMSELYRKVEAVIQTDHLKNFMREMSENFYETYGLISESDDNFHEKIARTFSMKWACQSGNEDCLYDTNELLHQFVYDDIELEPDTRESLICAGLRTANKDQLANFLKKIVNMPTKLWALRLISCIEDDEVLLYAIANISTNSNKFWQQNIFESIIRGSHHGFTVLWKYIADNWETFFDDFGTDFAMKMSEYIYRREEESVAMDIFNKLNSTFSEEFKLEFKAQVEKNLVWASSRYNEIDKFLTDYYSY